MNCLHCTADVTNGLTLCAKCQQTLTVALVNVAAFHTDVLRIRPGERVKVRSAYASAPPSALSKVTFDPISQAAEEIDDTVAIWCNTLTTARPNVGRAPATTVLRCGWLEGHLKVIATLDTANDLIRDMLNAERRLQRILDRSDTGWYAGKCGAMLANERTHDGTSCVCECHNGYACSDPGICSPDVPMIQAVVCERGLYATPGHGWIRCPECGTTHNAGNRRDQMMLEARDEIAPVSVIAKVVVGLIDTEQSVERLTNRIDQWVSRKQLHDLGVRVLDGRPRRVYRVGDVFDLLDVKMRTKAADAC